MIRELKFDGVAKENAHDRVQGNYIYNVFFDGNFVKCLDENLKLFAG